MNGTQRETNQSSPAPGGEDLNVVLGRFQSWAKTQSGKPASAYAAKSALHSGGRASAGAPPQEAREVSYEQALQASSYRRPDDLAALDRLLPEFKMQPLVSEKLHSPHSVGPPITEKKAVPVEIASMPDRASVGPSMPRKSERKRPPASSRVAGKGESRSAAAPRAKAQGEAQVEIQAEVRVETQVEARVQAKTEKKRRVKPRREHGRRDPVGTSSREAEISKTQAQARPASPRHASHPAFRDVLKGSPAMATATQSSAPAEIGKASSLTLRVSDQEQARIQACAAQAGVSVSAYLRQCALGVDELREQVQTALARVREEQAVPSPLPGLSAIPGILQRFAVQCLRRFRGNPASDRLLSLR